MEELNEDGVRVRRVITATPQQIWDDWTTAEGLERWWWTEYSDTVYESDAQVGGIYRIASSEGGLGVSGQFIDLEEPGYFEYSWNWHGGYADGEHHQQTVTVTLEEHEAGTLVTVTQTAPLDEVDAIQEGWEDSLTGLEELYD